jgi:hypothetical protein
MLLRPPDVAFYEIDRVAFVLLMLGVMGRAAVIRQRLFAVERATWPMLGLTLLAVASVVQQPFDTQTWSLLAAKFFVPFALFHLAGLVFREERRLRQFEVFALVVLAYLCFTSIAFLVGAKSLIFPRFILDESLGYHADRARCGSARERLSAFKVPTMWLLLESDDDVPRGATGKVDAHRLREVLIEAGNPKAPASRVDNSATRRP